MLAYQRVRDLHIFGTIQWGCFVLGGWDYNPRTCNFGSVSGAAQGTPARCTVVQLDFGGKL
jgi:hypothetical protein